MSVAWKSKDAGWQTGRGTSWHACSLHLGILGSQVGKAGVRELLPGRLGSGGYPLPTDSTQPSTVSAPHFHYISEHLLGKR